MSILVKIEYNSKYKCTEIKGFRENELLATIVIDDWVMNTSHKNRVVTINLALDKLKDNLGNHNEYKY